MEPNREVALGKYKARMKANDDERKEGVKRTKGNIPSRLVRKAPFVSLREGRWCGGYEEWEVMQSGLSSYTSLVKHGESLWSDIQDSLKPPEL